MKFIFYVLFFQTLIQFSYGQNSVNSQNKEVVMGLEKQFFSGTKLDKDFKFNFPGDFEELNIKTEDGFHLNGILFKAKEVSKGVIFYLHGTNNSLNIWGKIAPIYTNLNYDILILDYRGYGKSGSEVNSENQLNSDLQKVYNQLKLLYKESNIIIIGQSIGTGPAAKLASINNPKELILQAPYYSLSDWIFNLAPEVDTKEMKFQYKTYELFHRIKAPVIIFHGDADEGIYTGSSQKLNALFKKGDRLFILHGEGHNDFTHNDEYLKELRTLLK
nr:alpha/beta hydrolase [Pseudopedobacter sp.]